MFVSLLLSVCVPLLLFFSFVYLFRSEASEVPLLISRIACRSMHMWSFFHPESSLVYSTCFLFLLLIIHNVFRFKFSNPEEVCRQRDRATVRTNVHMSASAGDPDFSENLVKTSKP